jgi:putative colanic acid biosynthesis acetyltransferase WcaF
MNDLDPKRRPFFSGAPTFPLSHRLHRAAFQLAWLLLARWTPPPLRAWRAAILNVFGADVDPTANVYPSARVWYPPNLVVRERAVMGPGVICYCMDKITIGQRTVISQRSHLCAGTHNVDDADFSLQTAPITIGADAWVASEAFVGPGVTVGDGAVLGARAVTVKDLAPWSIYAGNPARMLRRRMR